MSTPEELRPYCRRVGIGGPAPADSAIQSFEDMQAEPYSTHAPSEITSNTTTQQTMADFDATEWLLLFGG